jgi:hypothetical protein
MTRFFIFLLFFVGLGLNATDPVALFHAIQRNEPETVTRLLASQEVDVNYQLTSAGAGVYELGMTPLLFALSLERLNIAKILLAHPNIDVNLVNGAQVSALHMLIMVNKGDVVGMSARIPAIFLPPVPVDFTSPQVKEESIIEIFNLLVEHGFNRWTNFATTGNENQNLVAEAIAHGKYYLGELILQNGGEQPQQYEHVFRMSGYLENSVNAGIFKQRYKNLMAIALTNEVKKELSCPAKIKQFAGYFAHSNSEDAKALVEMLLENHGSFGGTNTSKDYSDFLENAGRDLPETVKNVLKNLGN